MLFYVLGGPVHFQRMPFRVRFLTIRALVPLGLRVGFAHVLVQVARLTEPLATELAFVGAPVPVLPVAVAHQVPGLPELLSAQGTHHYPRPFALFPLELYLMRDPVQPGFLGVLLDQELASAQLISYLSSIST